MIAPRRFLLPIFSLVLLATTGCERLPALFESKDRAGDQAEQKQASGDYLGAVNSYEKSLDGTSKTADAHFRMGLLYEEKLNDTLSAAYHYRRYLALAPNGNHARDAKSNLGRLELTLATSLSGGTMINHAEALKLKNENVELRRQLALRGNNNVSFTSTPTTATAGATPANTPASGKPGKQPPVTARPTPKEAEKNLAPGSRTYKVQPGDTLASISRKFYKTRERTKDIQDANLNAVPDPTKLKPGQTLIIP